MSDLVNKINQTLIKNEFGKLYVPILFDEYLKKLQKNPNLIKTSFQRIYDMIVSYGSEGENPIHYNLFDDPFYNSKYALFGLDRVINNLMNCIKAGAEKFPIKDRILLFRGPPATGKTTLIKLLKKGLEEYSKTDEGATFSFFWNVNGNIINCPMNEEPLKLIPSEHRKKILKNLKIDTEVEGELCPVCFEQYKELLKKYDGDWSKVLEDVRIQRVIFSEKRKKGIGTVYPRGESEIFENYITQVNNELANSNLGLIEFIDLFKTIGPLNILLEASQSHQIEFKGEEVNLDTILLATTNGADYSFNLKKDETKMALADRIVEIRFPHTLNIKEEERIYKKDFDSENMKERGEHMSPHLLEVAAAFAVLTRFTQKEEILFEDDVYILFEEKLRKHSNKKIRLSEELSKAILKGSKEEALNENVVSPREMQNILSRLTTTNTFKEKKCLNTFALLSELEKLVKRNEEEIEESIEGYGGYAFNLNDYGPKLDFVKEIFFPRLYCDEIYEVIGGGESAVESKFDKYIHLVKTYIQNQKVTDKFTGEEKAPDGKFMKAVEKLTKTFNDLDEKILRQKIINEIASYHSKGKFNYQSYLNSNNRDKYEYITEIVDAIKEKLFQENKNIIDKLKLIKNNTLGEKDKKKVEEIKEKLMKEYGYCDHCATIALTSFTDEFYKD